MKDEGPDTATKLNFYACIGAELVYFSASLRQEGLTRLDSLMLSDNIQYICRHKSKDYLYVATSDGAPSHGPRGSRHKLTAVKTGAGTEKFSLVGPVIDLPSRPIHITIDPLSAHILVAFNNPSAIRIYRVNPDGTLGDEVAQSGLGELGQFVHQVRVAPDNSKVTLIARGNDKTEARAEQPGRISIFQFENGKLSPSGKVAPDGGFGFGPRDLDFHPNGRWVYVSLERENEMAMFEWQAGETLPLLYRKSSLTAPRNGARRQAVGPVHLHPDGKTAYLTNRANTAVNESGRNVFAGGENSIAVYSVDPKSGEPRVIQNIASGGIEPRTFDIDPSGQFMVVGHVFDATIKTPDGFAEILPCFSVFKIAADGSLEFLVTHNVHTDGKSLWWMGLVELGNR